MISMICNGKDFGLRRFVLSKASAPLKACKSRPEASRGFRI